MTQRASDIPVGTQFSPELIYLPEFLRAVVESSGNVTAIQKAVFAPPVHLKRNSVPESRRTSLLPLEAAVQYHLLSAGAYEATDLAQELAPLPADEVYRRFAAHILLNLNGHRVLQGIEQMQADFRAGLSGEVVTGDSLARYLTANGLRVSEHNTAINTMRMWLARAGIFPEKRGRDSWTINESVRDELLGVPSGTLESIDGLDAYQRAFLLALCRVNPSGWIRGSIVRDYAEATDEIGIAFPRASLPKQVLEPLQQAGFLEWRSGGTTGGKSAEVRTTPDFSAHPLRQFLEKSVQGLDPAITRYYRMRPDDIYAALESRDTYTKGQALEAYAIQLMRLLGLRLVEWRKRARDSTGRAEVDALMAGVLGSIVTTWQVQCKNSKAVVDVEDVAKEVGVIAITRATHLLFVTTSNFTKDARDFAGRVIEETGLSVYLVDGGDFQSIKANGAMIGQVMMAQSHQILSQRMSHRAWTRRP